MYLVIAHDERHVALFVLKSHKNTPNLRDNPKVEELYLLHWFNL